MAMILLIVILLSLGSGEGGGNIIDIRSMKIQTQENLLLDLNWDEFLLCFKCTVSMWTGNVIVHRLTAET